jgi:orotate phosphoribosyltransferase
MQILRSKTLKDLFLETGIIKINGAESRNRILVDTKETVTNPDILNEIVNTITDIGTTKDWCFDKIASFSLGGFPIATALSLAWNENQIIISPKSYIETQISNLPPRIIGDCLFQTCLLVEDHAFSGERIVFTTNEIRESGGSVTDAIVLIDLETGAEELCAKHGITLHSCIKKSDYNNLL